MTTVFFPDREPRHIYLKHFLTKSTVMATNALSAGISAPALFNDYFRPWNEWFNEGGSLFRNSLPAVNVSETDKEYRVTLAAPGLSREDFKVDVEGNLLVISSEKEEKRDDKNERFTRQEYRFSSFSRSFNLPEDVQKEKINATYKDGILRIDLPRKAIEGKGNGRKSINVM